MFKPVIFSLIFIFTISAKSDAFQNNNAFERGVDLFSALHLMKALVAPDSDQSSFIFGPIYSDIDSCINRAQYLDAADDIRNYAIVVKYGPEVISYEFNPIDSLESASYLLDDYGMSSQVTGFACARYVANDTITITVWNEE